MATRLVWPKAEMWQRFALRRGGKRRKRCARVVFSDCHGDTTGSRQWMSGVPLWRDWAAELSLLSVRCLSLTHGHGARWHLGSIPPTKRAAASPPSILQQTHRGAMISLFAPGRTRPDRHFARPRSVTPSPGHGHVLTDTDSLRHSRACGAPLLFWPTRKSPRQATPPPRHREQQHGDWRRTGKQMATPGGNGRFGSGERRKKPREGGSERRRLELFFNSSYLAVYQWCNQNLGQKTPFLWLLIRQLCLFERINYAI